MGKQVFLKRITLINFKGLRNVAIDFTGNITAITGKNGTGKTTVIDGFNWLLFGKDSEGNSETKFGIKTTGSDGAFIPHLEHEVTGTFEVTDTETGETETVTFRRVLVEEWKEGVNEETGETLEILKGHHTNYYYNEMPLKTKAEYDKLIEELIPEAIFKMITTPSYFPTLHWEKQREMLLQMAGEITDGQIVASNTKFAHLMELLQGKTLEGYKAKIKEDRTKIEADLQRIPTRIDEVTRNTPANIDFAELEAQLAQLTARYDSVEKAMNSVAEANRQAYEESAAVQRMVNDLRMQQQNILFAAQQKANEETQKANATHNEAAREIATLDSLLKTSTATYEANKRRLGDEQQRIEAKITEYTNQQKEARNKWFQVNAEDFNYGESLICPLFKHVCTDSGTVQAHTQNRNAARTKFLEDKEQRLAAINKEGAKLGEMIKSSKGDKDALSTELEQLTASYEQEVSDIKTRREKAVQRRDANALTTAPVLKGEDIPEWVEKQKRIDALQDEQKAKQPEGAQPKEVAELRLQRADLQREIDRIKAELQKKEQIARAEARIAELNEQKKELQKAKAQLQGKEDLVADFERAKMDEVERRVNAMFQFVQFKMYHQQIDQKQVPDCVCYIDGVRYQDKNKAGKINAGLDIINTLCAFYKVNAPIFIDNAESVNNFIPVESQLITLSVTTGDFAVN